jgi:hypothetical protein
VITQNIDGLHTMAGSSAVVELHGTDQTASCITCRSQFGQEVGVWGVGCWVWGLGFGVWGLAFGVWGRWSVFEYREPLLITFE